MKAPVYFSLMIIIALFVTVNTVYSADVEFAPGSIIEHGEYSGYNTKLHMHENEAFTPCMILKNKTDEIHLFIEKKGYDWIVASVFITEGSFSPIQGIKIGDSLSKLKKRFPDGKLMRSEGEIMEAAIFTTTKGKDDFGFSIEWEDTFYALGGNWTNFDVNKIPDSAKILNIMWSRE